jgi:hypothetical protein
MHLPDGLDDPIRPERLRNIDDDEVRSAVVTGGAKLAGRSFHGHRVASLTQPAFQQAKDLIVRFHHNYALLLHDGISNPSSVTSV